MIDVQAVKAYLLDLQTRIVAALEALDGRPFCATRGNGRPTAGAAAASRG